MRRCPWIAVLLSALFPAVAWATPVNIGFFSFDVLIPGGATPGVNVFNISNLTGGTPAAGFPAMDHWSFSIAPDVDEREFTGVVLSRRPRRAHSPISVEFRIRFCFRRNLYGHVESNRFSSIGWNDLCGGSPEICIELLPSFGHLSCLERFRSITISAAVPNLALSFCSGRVRF
jgi:hypothetical protein